jgi:hypothetical protein
MPDVVALPSPPHPQAHLLQPQALLAFALLHLLLGPFRVLALPLDASKLGLVLVKDAPCALHQLPHLPHAAQGAGTVRAGMAASRHTGA